MRSKERQRDKASRPMAAEGDARPERGTVIRIAAVMNRLHNVAYGKNT